MGRRREPEDNFDDIIIPWDIVVCINDDFVNETKEITYVLPKKGEVYTVRNTVNHGKGVIGLIFYELINPPVLLHNYDGSQTVIETTFNVNRFKRVGHYSEIVNLFIDDENFLDYFEHG